MTTKIEAMPFIREKSEMKILSVDISRIISHNEKNVDNASAISLADSINKHGLLSPITVRPVKKPSENEFSGSEIVKKLTDDTEYELIIGERRLKAMKILGKQTIPCIICSADDKECAEIRLVDEISHKPLNMFEYAEMIEDLINTYSLRQEDVASRLSTSQPNIANKLRLLRFSKKEREIILENMLTERHARALLKIKDEEKRYSALCEMAELKMSLKDAEAFVDELTSLQNGDFDISSRMERIYNDARAAINLYSKSDDRSSVIKYETDKELRITVRIIKK